MQHAIKPINVFIFGKLLKKELSLEWKQDSRWAEVLAAGPGNQDIYGGQIPVPFKEGDLIYCMNHGINNIAPAEQYGTAELFLISVYDVMGKIVEQDNMKKFKPYGQLVLIKRDQMFAESAEGLVMPGDKKTPYPIGTVIELGDGWIDSTGKEVEHQVSIGDKVYFLPRQTMKVDLDLLGDKEATDYILVNHSDIMGVIQ